MKAEQKCKKTILSTTALALGRERARRTKDMDGHHETMRIMATCAEPTAL
jgi:hypothetical protein